MNILKINLTKYSFRHVVLDFYFVSVCEHVKGARLTRLVLLSINGTKI